MLEVKGAPADAAWAQLTTYVPSGYTINLGQPVGTRIGSVFARAQLLGSGAGATDRGQRARRRPERRRRSAGRDAVHALAGARGRLDASGSPSRRRRSSVPLYVDPTTGAEAAFGSAKLVLCLPQPYAKGLPGYAPLGTKLDDLRTTLSAGVFTNPLFAGSHVWRTVVTPWSPSGAAPDAGSDRRDPGPRRRPVVAVAEGEAHDDARGALTREELGAPERHAARGPARRRRRHGLVLRDGQERRHRDRRARPASFARKIVLTQRKTFRVDGDRADARDARA